MTALGYPSFKGYHRYRFPKEILLIIYQAAMRGKRMRLFAYRVFLANLLKHLLEFTLHSERRKAARETKKQEKLEARRALKEEKLKTGEAWGQQFPQSHLSASSKICKCAFTKICTAAQDFILTLALVLVGL